MEPSFNACSEMNFTDKTCFEFSERGFWAVVGCRTGFSSVGTLMSALALLYFISVACSVKGPVARHGDKIRVKPAARLALYLCIASFFNGIMTAIQIVPVANGLTCGHIVVNSFCVTAATLLSYTVWAILVLMFWIYVEIVMAVLMTSENENYRNSRCCRTYNHYRDSIYYDGCVIATTLSIPNIYCHVPLKLYGLAGAWCWIKTRDDECHKIVAGIAEQFALWYAWAMLFIVVFSVTAIVIWVVIYTRKQIAADAVQDNYDQYLKDARPFVIYPIIFAVIYGLGFANRIVYAFHEKTIVPLWIIHGIAEPQVCLLIPLYFLLRHRKKLDQLPPEREPLLPNDM